MGELMLDRRKIARRLTKDVDGDLQFVSDSVLKARHHQLSLAALDDLKVHLIDETRQKSGSFKYRGAVLGVRNSKRGVVACGSGNFPIAVGQAASDLGYPALLVMPDDAPPLKKKLAEQSGSETRFVRRTEFVEIARQEADARSWTALHPFQNPEMLLGSCTLGFEVAEAIGSSGTSTDAVVAACGGGGLAAGIALGVRLKGAANAIYVVEPMTHARLAAAYAAGSPVEITPKRQTKCDALRVTRIGNLAFDVIQDIGVSPTTASDDGVEEAQSLLTETCGVYAEPSGALALAALLERRIPRRHDRVWVVVCGGNV